MRNHIRERVTVLGRWRTISLGQRKALLPEYALNVCSPRSDGVIKRS